MAGRLMRRKKATLAERLTPCRVCTYPITERHHLLLVSRRGEGGETVQLCANCHEAFHIFERAHVHIKQGKYDTAAVQIMTILRDYLGAESRQVQALTRLVQAVFEKEERDAISAFDAIVDSLIEDLDNGRNEGWPQST